MDSKTRTKLRKKIVLNKIKNAGNYLNLHLNKFFSEETYLVNQTRKLYAQNELSKEEIRRALEFRIQHLIFPRLRKIYSSHVEAYKNEDRNNPFLYLDHIGREDLFVHGIENGAFSWFKKRKLHFDHEQNLNEYIQEYGNPHLIEGLLEQIIPRETKREGTFASHYSLFRTIRS